MSYRIDLFVKARNFITKLYPLTGAVHSVYLNYLWEATASVTATQGDLESYIPDILLQIYIYIRVIGLIEVMTVPIACCEITVQIRTEQPGQMIAILTF